MFGKKKKRYQPACVELLSASGDALFSGRLDALTIPEAHIIALSIEYFSDPEPCYIHRGAVLSRAFAEIERALTGGEWLEIARLAPAVRAHLGGYQAERIRMNQGGEI